jgi:hypothetical protein
MHLLKSEDILQKIELKRNYDEDFSKDIDNQISDYVNNFKVVIYEATTGLHSITFYALLFDNNKPLPDEVNETKNLLVNIDGKWKRKCLLGICDGCGKYDELVMSCCTPREQPNPKNGEYCRECSKESWF